MSKFRSSIFIFGSIILCVAVALATFLALSATGMIVTDPIELTFAVHDIEKEYDGTPLVADSYALLEGELREGHTATVTYTGAQTDVGIGQSGLQVKIEDADGFDVSKQYAVRVTNGLLTVTARPLSVKPEDVEAEYTGAPVFGETYAVLSGSLAAGHTLKPSSAVVSAVAVGTTPNTVRPNVFDAAGHDVTENYAIEFTPGSVTVSPRVLRVAPCDATKVYDGTPLTVQSYALTIGTLVSGHRLQVEYATEDGEAAELTDVGALKVQVAGFHVTDAAGEDMTDNYELYPAATATLTVGKADARVTLKPLNVVYGDRLQTTVAEAVLDASGVTASELVLQLPEHIDLNDAGTYTYSVDWAPGIDKSGNYNLVVTPGTLTIAQRELSVLLKHIVTTYSGQPYLPNIGDALPDDLPTTVREGLQLLHAANMENIGTYAYTADWKADATAQKNYRLRIAAGAVVIEPKFIEVDLETSLQKTYDGAPYTFPTEAAALVATVNQGVSIEEMTAVLEPVVPIAVNAGAYTFTVRLNDTEKSANYRLRVRQPGMLTIAKAMLAAPTYDYGHDGAAPKTGIEKVYDGKPATLDTSKFAFADNADLYVAEATLAPIVYVTTDERGNPTAQMAAVTGMVVRSRSTGENAAVNYELPTEISLNVTIQKRQVLICAENLTLREGETLDDLVGNFYDDQQYFGLLKPITSLVGVDRLDVSALADMFYQDDTTLVVEGAVIRNGNGLDVTGNYEIVYGYGTVTYMPAGA